MHYYTHNSFTNWLYSPHVYCGICYYAVFNTVWKFKYVHQSEKLSLRQIVSVFRKLIQRAFRKEYDQ
jgi:hypothetical protein